MKITTFSPRAPYAGQIEIDTLVTVSRPAGRFFVVLIALQNSAEKIALQ